LEERGLGRGLGLGLGLRRGFGNGAGNGIRNGRRTAADVSQIVSVLDGRDEKALLQDQVKQLEKSLDDIRARMALLSPATGSGTDSGN